MGIKYTTHQSIMSTTAIEPNAKRIAVSKENAVSAAMDVGEGDEGKWSGGGGWF